MSGCNHPGFTWVSDIGLALFSDQSSREGSLVALAPRDDPAMGDGRRSNDTGKVGRDLLSALARMGGRRPHLF